MRNLLLNFNRALTDLAASIGGPEPAPKRKHAGGRPPGSGGKRLRDCLRALSGPDGAGTFVIGDISRTYGKPITGSKIQRELATLIQAGHVASRAGMSFQMTEAGLAMLHATKPVDDLRSK